MDKRALKPMGKYDMIPLKGRDRVDGKNEMPLASEMYEDLKQHTLFLRKMVVKLLLVIALLVAGLVGTNLFHIWQWSQFDTFVVDTSGGDGNANLIQGDNTGGVFNGTDRSQGEEGQAVPGEPGEGGGGQG